MNNKAKIYARALAEAIIAGKASEKKIVDNFLKLLEKEGCQKKGKEILALAEGIILKKQGRREIIFETARKMTATQRKLLVGFAKKGDIVSEKIDPKLIAGIKITINESRQFDASMQSKLQNLNI